MGGWSAGRYRCPLWEHRPRCDEGDGGLRGLIAAGAPLLQGESNAAWAMGGGLRGVIAVPCGSAALGAMRGGGLRGLIVAGALLLQREKQQGKMAAHQNGQFSGSAQRQAAA